MYIPYTSTALLLTSVAIVSVSVIDALPALIPCASASNGKSDRWGICGGDAKSPISLRGSNYIRLGGSNVPSCTGLYHTTFDTGVYNRTRYIFAFEAMQRQGYNVARVFLDERVGCGIGGAANAAEPLDPTWLDRLAQFVSDAEAHGLYTLVTMVYTPSNAYFNNVTKRIPQDAAWDTGGWNTNFLTARGHKGYETYGSLLAEGLKTRLSIDAQHAVIISLQNEFFLRGDLFPFTHNATVDSFANGVAYDMRSPEDRQEAADANTNAWASKLSKAIRSYLPSTLVTVGVFTYAAVQKHGPNGLIAVGCGPSTRNLKSHIDCRFPARPYKLSQSGIDFLDVHIYEADGSPQALAANLKTEEWHKIPKSKPIIMGEFGCNSKWYPNATVCSPHVRQLQISSCAAGFTSWLFWTYDSNNVQRDWYDMIGDDGAINFVLSPTNNPHPREKKA